jgi:hypothetical protein
MAQKKIKNYEFMKNTAIYIIILSMFTLASCLDMDESYREYIVPNGKIYPQKADSLKVFPGKNRVKIAWLKLTDPSVTNARIYWNNFTDSISVDVASQNGEVISYIVDNLPENTYTFNVKTYDKDGNVSVPSEVTGTVYGDNYQSSLLARPVFYLFVNDANNSVDIQWGATESSVVRVVLKYVTSSGNTVEREVDLDEEWTIMSDCKPGSTFTVETYYLPEANAIDEFFVSGEYRIPNFVTGEATDRNTWKILFCNSDKWFADPNNPNVSPGWGDHGIYSILDGDISTWWRGNVYGEGNASPGVDDYVYSWTEWHAFYLERQGYPVTVVIDMQRDRIISGVGLAQGGSPTELYVKNLEIYVSDDAAFLFKPMQQGGTWDDYQDVALNNWKKTLTFDGIPEEGGRLLWNELSNEQIAKNIDNNVKGRFLKIKFTGFYNYPVPGVAEFTIKEVKE